MSFLSPFWLLGLIGLLVPIVLHMRRRQTKTMNWAAMRFVKTSLTTRRRGLTLEQYLLLLCRCLLWVAFVSAMARPWSLSDRTLPSMGLLTLMATGVGLLAWGSVSSTLGWRRPVCLGSGVGLLLLLGCSAWFQDESLWNASEQPCDVVLIVDGSDSMELNSDLPPVTQETNFAAALGVAEQFLEKLPPESTAAVLVGGSVHSGNHVRLQRNLQAVREELRAARCGGQSTQLSELVEQARSILRQGRNARQQIVLLSDNQWTNWESLSEELKGNPDANANETEASSTSHAIPIFGRVFSLPETCHNLAVTKIEIDDKTWRVGENVQASVEIFNGGSQPTDDVLLEIRLDNELLESKPIGPIPPSLRQTISIDFTCDQIGSHVLSAHVAYPDDLPNDNQLARAFAVQGAIPVLIINGDLANSPTGRSARFVQLALSSRITAPEMIDARDLTNSFDFRPFQAVILCDVPSLPAEVADSLANHIGSGAGLWVFLGPNCESSFYNGWQWQTSNLLPVPVGDSTSRVQVHETGLGIDISSVEHTALDRWIKSGEHDLLEWRAKRIWQFDLPMTEQNNKWQLALCFSDGQPFLLERSLGNGQVLLQTSLPDPSDNNFINRVSFPVWMHLLTRHLASQLPIHLHHHPSPRWIVELPRTEEAARKDMAADHKAVSLTLTSPDGTDRPVSARPERQNWVVELGNGQEPGHYRLSGEMPTVLGSSSWSLTIGRDGQEADLKATNEQQLSAIAEQIGIELWSHEFQWVQAATGMPVTVEWWSTLAYLVMGLLVLESMLLQWIQFRRSETGDIQSLTARLAQPLIWVLLSGIWLGTWLSCSYGWEVIGALLAVTFNRSLFWHGILVATLSCLTAWTCWNGRLYSFLFNFPSLKFTRLLLLGLLGFVLLEPVQTRDEESSASRRIVVLWDRSDSMQLQEASATREEIAQQILWKGINGSPPLLDQLEIGYEVDLIEFARNARSVDADGAERSARPERSWTETTDLSTALQRVIDQVPIENLSGVIVLTDGCDRSTTPPIHHAAIFVNHEIPVHSIVIGNQTPGTDAEVVSLQVAEQVFAGDQVKIQTSLKFDQLLGKTAQVRLLRDGELLKTATVPITGNQFRTNVPFVDLPSENGLHCYSVVIDPMEGEEHEFNNERVASVWVTNDRLRLLVIDQRPRWEFRYLKNMFAGRDQNVSLQYVLLSPDRLAGVPDPVAMSASTARAFDDCEANRLPDSEKEWLKFDVIVLGDVDPSQLDLATQRTLQKFVGQRGGTLIVVAGPHAMPHRYLDGPLGELMPAQMANPTFRTPESAYRLRLTEDGRSGSLMQSSLVDANRPAMWETLPNLYWRNSVSKAKPGATVLAWADEDHGTKGDESAANQALILWHRYGGGRVLQLNFDQTWRLRFWKGDEHHHRFWGRVMRWGTEDRLGMGTDLVRMGIDKSHYNIGDPLTVKLRLMDDQSVPEQEPDLRVLLFREDEQISDYSFTEIADSGGLQQSQFTLPDVPGRYRVQVVGRTIERLLQAENRAEQTVGAEFVIDGSLPESEENDIVASPAVVGPLAHKTGGAVLEPKTAQQVLEKLGPQSTYRREVSIMPVWNTWPIVTLFFTLLIGEWLVRRRRQLI